MKKVGLQTWHLTYPHFWSKYIHPLISCWSILHLVRRLCSISPSVAIGPAMRGAALGGVFEVGLSLNLETQLKKKERKKWFERWFAERSFYVFVMGSEKLRSTWCLKKQGPALRSWASSEQRNLWVWGKRDKTLCKTAVSRFSFVLSLFAIHSPVAG